VGSAATHWTGLQGSLLIFYAQFTRGYLTPTVTAFVQVLISAALWHMARPDRIYSPTVTGNLRGPFVSIRQVCIA
jgi:hypothetical protein